MFKASLVAAVTVLLATAACSKSENTTDGGSAGNPIETLASDVVNYMATATPSVTSASSLIETMATDWASDNTHLYAPGCSAPGNQSIRNYVRDVLDAGYECGEFSPTVFGRFAEEMMVLYIIGSQVPFVNGAPAVGDHEVSVVLDDSQPPAQFPVAVTAVEDSEHFDVKLRVDNDFMDWTAYFRNRDGHTNLVSYEFSEKDDNESTGVSRLYWNRTSGALTYSYISQNDDVAASGELQKLVITETGASRIGHFMVNAGNEPMVLIDAPQGGASTTFSVAFEQGGSNPIGAIGACVNASTGSAEAGFCSGVSIPVSDFSSGAVNALKTANNTNLLTAIFGGSGESDILDYTPNYTLTDFATEL